MRPSFHVAALTGLVLLVGYVYRPALDHGPRADHMCVLTDTFDDEQFWPLLQKLYSYNRTREVFGGDEVLFRPVLFTLIAAEKAAFGHDFFLWQLTSLLMHLAVLFLLLSILLRLHRLFGPVPFFVPLAYGMVYFFAVNPAVIEMVIWSHINGYMLFLLFAPGAMRLSLSGKQHRHWPIWFLVLLGAFTHEIGQYYAVVVGLLLGMARRERRRRQALLLTLLFLTVPCLYQLTNRLDRAAHGSTCPDVMAEVARNATPQRTARNAGRYLHYTMLQPFFPSARTLQFTERVRVLYLPMEQLPTVDPASLVSCAVLALVVLVTLASRASAARLRIALLPASLIALHLGTTVLGRMNLHEGVDVLENNSYYTYFPVLLGTIILGTLWSGGANEPWLRGRGLAIVQVLLLSGLAILTAIGAQKTRALNVEGRSQMRALVRGTRSLVELVRAHRNDPHFALSFHPEVVTRLGTFYWVPLTLTLFHDQLDHDNPSHVAIDERGILKGIPVAEYRRRFPEGDTTKLCYVVRVGRRYNVFRHRGEFFALLRDDCWYSPERDDYRELIRGATLADILEKLPPK